MLNRWHYLFVLSHLLMHLWHLFPYLYNWLQIILRTLNFVFYCWFDIFRSQKILKLSAHDKTTKIFKKVIKCLSLLRLFRESIVTSKEFKIIKKYTLPSSDNFGNVEKRFLFASVTRFCIASGISLILFEKVLRRTFAAYWLTSKAVYLNYCIMIRVLIAFSLHS